MSNITKTTKSKFNFVDSLVLEITLEEIEEPQVRRIICVPHNITLTKLNDVIQTAMGWMGCHLHSFTINDEEYGEVDPDYDDYFMTDQKYKRLSSVLGSKKTFSYLYDFGDSWQHKIKVKKGYPMIKGDPACLIAGEGACPPEDVGGIWGYAEFKLILADKSHPEYEDTLEWCGDDFDISRFDLKETQARLNRMK